MSVKIISKGAKGKRNENVQKILQHHSTAPKPVVFHNASKPSPILSDRNEFPSLNESSIKSSNNSFSAGKILKYSDTLKSNSFSKTQDVVPENFHSKSNTVASNSLGQVNERIHNGKSNFNKEKIQNTSQDYSSKPRSACTNKVGVNPNQKTPKKQLIQSSKEYNSLNQQQLAQVDKKDLSKHKCMENSLTNSKGSVPRRPPSKSANINVPKSKNQVQFNRSKIIDETKRLKEEAGDDVQSNTKKKKKRNSKVKRQAALQSGKITVLTPEVHSKILNQTTAIVPQTSKSVFTDINDEEEYPELGKPLVPTNQKGNYSKRDISAEPSKETEDKPPDTQSGDKLPITRDVKESSACDVSEKPVKDKKGTGDSKATVHPNDPITISFYDILLNKNSKPKVSEFEEEIATLKTIGIAKIKTKKDTSHPHNLLDSSSPMVKRGKEREKPKPKKPSQLKKIILLDRKMRKEQFLNLKSNNPEGNDAVDNEHMDKLNTDELDNEVDIIETCSPTENNSSNELEEIAEETLVLLSDISADASLSQPEETFSENPSLTSDNEDTLQVELVPKIEQFNISETSMPVINDLSSSSTLNEDTKARDCIDNVTLSLDKVCQNEAETNVISSAKIGPALSPEVSSPPGSLLGSLLNSVKKSEISDKERAAKILLHTRNFRAYCNHLISKDIDDAVFSLLDDLARFQDRLHQKDPVKARMKRRMINGIKEVKKYIKLRKLKCIIIAVDIENVEAQGGLNDILNEIKVSAADHHIPCIFALGRKVLGKVCRKPVPISCVGVLNFEGSEVNFRKMVELQTQSKTDYNEIFSKLTQKLTDDEAASLLKAKTEAPETLREIRTDILNDFFMTSKTDSTKNADIKCQI